MQIVVRLQGKLLPLEAAICKLQPASRGNSSSWRRATEKDPPPGGVPSMLLPLRPEPKESSRREAGSLGTLALKRQKMKVLPEQDSNPRPSTCETSAFLLRHLAFHTN